MKDQSEFAALDAAVAESSLTHELSQERRNAMARKIMTTIGGVPAPLGTETLRHHEGEWEELMDRVEMKVLRQDPDGNNHTVLYRLAPGAVFPSHSHTQEEECYVIEGSIGIDGHIVRAGDWHLAKPGYEHPTIVSDTGALLLVRSQIT